MNKKLDVHNFDRSGYLQECNRNFFNPLGLYMKIEDGQLVVYDFRDIPQGVAFRNVDQEHAEKICHEFSAKSVARMREFGWVIQPSTEVDPH